MRNVVRSFFFKSQYITPTVVSTNFYNVSSSTYICKFTKHDFFLTNPCCVLLLSCTFQDDQSFCLSKIDSSTLQKLTIKLTGLYIKAVDKLSPS